MDQHSEQTTEQPVQWVVHEVEHGLQVPMGKAVTMTLKGALLGFPALYLATSAFSEVQPSDRALQKLAESIAQALSEREVGDGPTME